MADNTMQALDPVQRRRAAFMTLSEVLEGEQLMRAMWMLEERDQSANKFTFIGFVGVTAELLGINSSIVTSFYPKLNHNLDLADEQLVDDPMLQMLEYRGKSNKQPAVNQESATPIEQIKKASKNTRGSPEMNVFAALISQIVSEAGYPQAESYHAFKMAFKDEIASAKLEDANRKQILAWVDVLSLKAFNSNIALAELTTIVHCLYIALCEALGPVKADKVLNHAIVHSSKIPAAKIFSPKKFL